jgi:hypothetical protein
MALTFEPGKGRYDPNRDVVRFWASEGPRFIHCAVSGATLIKLDRAACSVPVDLARLYHRHRQRIHAAARRKHWSRKSEPGGEILVESSDLAIE